MVEMRGVVMAVEEHSECTKGQYPDKLTSRHRALMRLQVAGLPLKDAARDAGYTLARASLIVGSPLYKFEKSKMEEELRKRFIDAEGSKITVDAVRKRFKDEALNSIDKLVKLRDGAQSERVQQISAMDILDRSGYKEPEKLEVDAIVEVGEGLANALKEAVVAIRSKNGSAVEK